MMRAVMLVGSSGGLEAQLLVREQRSEVLELGTQPRLLGILAVHQVDAEQRGVALVAAGRAAGAREVVALAEAELPRLLDRDVHVVAARQVAVDAKEPVALVAQVEQSGDLDRLADPRLLFAAALTLATLTIATLAVVALPVVALPVVALTVVALTVVALTVATLAITIAVAATTAAPAVAGLAWGLAIAALTVVLTITTLTVTITVALTVAIARGRRDLGRRAGARSRAVGTAIGLERELPLGARLLFGGLTVHRRFNLSCGGGSGLGAPTTARRLRRGGRGLVATTRARRCAGLLEDAVDDLGLLRA